MGTVMVLWSLLSTCLVLGFSYIIWILACKESGYLKIGGQILAGVIKVLAIILFIYSLVIGCQMKMPLGGKMDCPMMGGKGDGQKMMMEMMKKNPEMMKMMKEKMEQKGAQCK
jgi:hypothetical protein